jgi:3-methyladenine DNA glycosylase AlkD
MMTQPTPTFEKILAQLNLLANPAGVTVQQRFGIRPAHPLGISMPQVRALAKGVRDHALALQLWQTGIHEARILASLVDDPKLVTLNQMETCVLDFDAWDLCDQVCSNLFDRTVFAVDRAQAWPERQPEYVRRAGFVLMAGLATRRKKEPDETFLQFLPLIVHYSTDSRNFVRKAVNWALRGIGKRNPALRAAAIQTANHILMIDSPTAHWVARDALRELSRPERSTRPPGR